jgi:LuxR family maltose regulon positive regulatory protein
MWVQQMGGRFHTNRAMPEPTPLAFGGCAGEARQGKATTMSTHATGQTARARRPAVPAGHPILVAKITAPGVPDWALPRPRISKLIARGARWCPLTVLTGPPGAGKTMALALWAEAEAGPVAWLSLEEYDDRTGSFWSYVIAALRQSGVAVPRVVAGRARVGDHAFQLHLASALAAQDPPVRLVLDDFHLLTQPKVLTGLDFVLRHTGPGLRLMVASRADPLLPLHRYRLAGELAEIRAGDLAFTGAEAAQLLAQHGSPLSAASVDCLTRRTEGWAAGIRLAALSMDTSPDPDQFVKELTAEDSALTSYLVEEVLNTQPPEIREVLLATSILDHVSPDAASELAGNDQAGRILAGLAHTNAFVQPAGGGWYRYHTVFAEVLRLKLAHQSPGRVSELHRRAARWYQRNGILTGAVRHAARAGDWQLAASMIIDGLAISDIIEPGPDPSLAAEFAGMPLPAGGDQPQPYLVCAAVALTTGRAESSAAVLGIAEDLLQHLPADQQVTAPAGRCDDPACRRPPRREPYRRRGGGQRQGAGKPDSGRHARPASGTVGPAAVGLRDRRAVVRRSGRGGPAPGCGSRRRGHPGYG